MQNKPGNKDTVMKTETYGGKNQNKRNTDEKYLRNSKKKNKKRPQNLTLLVHLHCYCPSILILLTVCTTNTDYDDVCTITLSFH
jgi:hypothetical protein